MRYFGGKARIAKKLTEFLNSEIERLGIKTFIEPFVGGLNITPLIRCELRIASDKAETPVLYKALLEGFELSNTVSKLEYQTTLQNYTGSPLDVFMMYGCSFGGKFKGGFAGNGSGRNYALNAKNSLLKKIKTCQDVVFLCKQYQDLPHPKNALIYCDPPYINTTGYINTGKFNHDEFWQWVRDMSKQNHVYVSEYTAPDDFKVVWQIETKTDIRIKDGTKSARTERLFKWKND